MRWRLTSKEREELYASEVEKAGAVGHGDLPLCNICAMPILPGREWDASHDPAKPRWLDGAITGIAHPRCNRINNNKFATPLFAKSERVRKRFLDFTRSRTPMAGGRDDRLKKKMNGRVVERAPE